MSEEDPFEEDDALIEIEEVEELLPDKEVEFEEDKARRLSSLESTFIAFAVIQALVSLAWVVCFIVATLTGTTTNAMWLGYLSMADALVGVVFVIAIQTSRRARRSRTFLGIGIAVYVVLTLLNLLHFIWRLFVFSASAVDYFSAIISAALAAVDIVAFSILSAMRNKRKEPKSNEPVKARATPKRRRATRAPGTPARAEATPTSALPPHLAQAVSMPQVISVAEEKTARQRIVQAPGAHEKIGGIKY